MTTSAAVVAIFLSVGGCGSPPEPVQPGGPETSTTTSGSTSAQHERTLRGRVEAGVEAGCLVLESGGESYLLFGAEAQSTELKPGAKVEVTGHVGTDVASFCQQGTPFVVESVRPG